MGQQQLLLIALSIIIVGVAIVVGITLLASSKSEANRQALVGDLMNLARKAQGYCRTPAQMGGGSLKFTGFALSAIDTGNANGSFSITTGSPPSDANFVNGSINPVSGDVQTLYIIACGKEQGNNKSTPVKCYITVTKNSFYVKILN